MCETMSSGTCSPSSNHPDVDGHGKHFCHYAFPSPAWPPRSIKLLFLSPPLVSVLHMHMRMQMHAHKKCIDTISFFPQIKFVLAFTLQNMDYNLYLRDISHIAEIAIGLHSHVGANQRCNIFTAMAFQQEKLKFLQSTWSEFILLLGWHYFLHGRDQLRSGWLHRKNNELIKIALNSFTTLSLGKCSYYC